MHLLCINLLVLVLLPSSLSCEGKAEPAAVRDHFIVFVKMDMDNIRDKLQNRTCQEGKYIIANCTENADIVETLLLQACEMQRLKLRNMIKLANTVQTSINCKCPMNMTKDHSVRSQRRKTTRNTGKKIKKHCKAKAILSSMTVCYQRLNTQQTDARN